MTWLNNLTLGFVSNLWHWVILDSIHRSWLYHGWVCQSGVNQNHEDFLLFPFLYYSSHQGEWWKGVRVHILWQQKWNESVALLNGSSFQAICAGTWWHGLKANRHTSEVPNLVFWNTWGKSSHSLASWNCQVAWSAFALSTPGICSDVIMIPLSKSRLHIFLDTIVNCRLFHLHVNMFY